MACDEKKDEFTDEAINEMLHNGSMYDRFFYRFKQQPTENNYNDIIQVLCDMDQIWISARAIPLPGYEEINKIAREIDGFFIRKDGASIKSDIHVMEDGTRIYPIYTKAMNIIPQRDYGNGEFALSAMPTTMDAVLKIMGNEDNNATQIIVNFMCDTQIQLDEDDIELAEYIVEQNKKYAEENDEQYQEGRKCEMEAMTLYFGLGVKKDKNKAMLLYEKAAKLLKIAAERGNSKAQYSLGLLIRNGHGIEQDFEKAAYWLRQSVLDCDEDEEKEIEKLIGKFKFYKEKKK